MSGNESKMPALTHITGNEYEMNWPSVWITTPSGRKYRIEDRGLDGDRIDHSLITGTPPTDSMVALLADTDGQGEIVLGQVAEEVRDE